MFHNVNMLHKNLCFHFLDFCCICRNVDYSLLLHIHIVYTGKWYVMSLVKTPLVVCLFKTFVKMLSIRVADSVVTRVGLLIRGYRFRLFSVNKVVCS